MNNAELENHIHLSAEISRLNAHRALLAIISGIIGAISRNVPVKIHGIGTLHIVNRRARTRKNPQTGASINVPAHRELKYSYHRSIFDAVN